MNPVMVSCHSSEVGTLSRLLAASLIPSHAYVIVDEHSQLPPVNLVEEAMTIAPRPEPEWYTISSEMLKSAYEECYREQFSKPDNRPFYTKIQCKTRNKRR